MVSAALRHSSLWEGRGCFGFEVGVRANELDWQKITGNSEWLQRRAQQAGQIIDLWYMVHDENGGVFTPFGGWHTRLRDIASKGRLSYSICQVSTPGVYQATEWRVDVPSTAAAETRLVVDNHGLKLPGDFPLQLLEGLLRAPGDIVSAEWRK